MVDERLCAGRRVERPVLDQPADQDHGGEAGGFMCRFLAHVLHGGFQRIGHCGLLSNGSRTARLAL